MRTMIKPRGERGADRGTTRVHEPAHAPDPEAYVSWDDARGFADAVLSLED